MTIPVYAVGAVSLVAQAYLSDLLQRRALFLVGSAVPVIVGYLICIGTPQAAAGYGGMFILCLGMASISERGGCSSDTRPGVYPISTLIVTWVATNLSPDYKRSVALPVFYSVGNLSGLVSSQLYPSQQGPRYIMGNSISAGLEVVAAVLFMSTWFLLRRRNAKKERLTAEGATSNGLEGDQALGFKYML